MTRSFPANAAEAPCRAFPRHGQPPDFDDTHAQRLILSSRRKEITAQHEGHGDKRHYEASAMMRGRKGWSPNASSGQRLGQLLKA